MNDTQELIARYMFYKDKLNDARQTLDAQNRITQGLNEIGSHWCDINSEEEIESRRKFDEEVIQPMRDRITKYKEIVDGLSKEIEDRDEK